MPCDKSHCNDNWKSETDNLNHALGSSVKRDTKCDTTQLKEWHMLEGWFWYYLFCRQMTFPYILSNHLEILVCFIDRRWLLNGRMSGVCMIYTMMYCVPKCIESCLLYVKVVRCLWFIVRFLYIVITILQREIISSIYKLQFYDCWFYFNVVFCICVQCICNPILVSKSHWMVPRIQKRHIVTVYVTVYVTVKARM